MPSDSKESDALSCIEVKAKPIRKPAAKAATPNKSAKPRETSKSRSMRSTSPATASAVRPRPRHRKSETGPQQPPESATGKQSAGGKATAKVMPTHIPDTDSDGEEDLQAIEKPTIFPAATKQFAAVKASSPSTIKKSAHSPFAVGKFLDDMPVKKRGVDEVEAPSSAPQAKRHALTTANAPTPSRQTPAPVGATAKPVRKPADPVPKTELYQAEPKGTTNTSYTQLRLGPDPSATGLLAVGPGQARSAASSQSPLPTKAATQQKSATTTPDIPLHEQIPRYRKAIGDLRRENLRQADDINRLNKDVEVLRLQADQVDPLKKTLSTLEEEVEKLKADKEKVQEEMAERDRVVKEVNKRQLENNSIEQAKRRYEAEQIRSAKDLAASQAETESAEKAAKEFKKQADSLRLEAESAKSEAQVKDRLAKDLEEQVKAHLKTISDLQVDVKAANFDRDAAETRAGEMKSQHRALEAQIDELKATIEQKDKELAAARTESKKQVEKMDTETKAKDEEIKKLQATVDWHRKTLEERQKEHLKELSNAKNGLDKAAEDLKAKNGVLDAKQRDISQLKMQLENLQKQAAASSERLCKANQSLTAANKTTELVEKSRDALKKKVEDLQLELTQKQSRLSSLETNTKKVEDLKKQLDEKNAELSSARSSARASSEGLSSEIAALRKEVEAFAKKEASLRKDVEDKDAAVKRISKELFEEQEMRYQLNLRIQAFTGLFLPPAQGPETSQETATIAPSEAGTSAGPLAVEGTLVGAAGAKSGGAAAATADSTPPGEPITVQQNGAAAENAATAEAARTASAKKTPARESSSLPSPADTDPDSVMPDAPPQAPSAAP
ncbi:hypothetical protein QBC34DRAFT_76833 [Podospora aff. communis PSN243]|uniref:Myosin heavy chain n=1 Tax=Podospora aff. communis PSN243 TaxID=3040156 RepID=A0AAV9GRR2_9PEZI|nr:hypothetical protein QBC34DRAFT_76833 [Podospora aff. communis PSN243]